MNWRFICLFVLIFSWTGCKVTGTKTINPIKGEAYANIGYGVYLPLPPGYKKGKSFQGYQAPNMKGSIEILLEQNFDDLKNYYSKSAIKSRDGSIKIFQPLIVNGITDAFYVEYHDTPQLRHRYIYVLQKENRVYHIKGFLRLNANEDDKWDMRNSILSSYFDAYQEEETSFSIPHMITLNSFYFTRDNKFPTEELDSAFFRVTTLQNASFDYESARNFIYKKSALETNQKPPITYENLVNGMLYEASTSDDTKQVYLMLMTSEDSGSAFVEGIGNKQMDMKEFKRLAKSKFMTVQ